MEPGRAVQPTLPPSPAHVPRAGHRTHPGPSLLRGRQYCAKSLQSCLTLCDSMGCSPPGSSIRGIPRREYRTGVPCLPPGGLPHPGVEPTSLLSLALAGGFFITKPPGKPESSPWSQYLRFTPALHRGREAPTGTERARKDSELLSSDSLEQTGSLTLTIWSSKSV